MEYFSDFKIFLDLFLEIFLRIYFDIPIMLFYFVPMIPITGYTQKKYSEFQAALNDAFDKSGKYHLQVASEIKVKSSNTVKNALLLDSKQSVSDEVLTAVMKSVGLSGLVVWIFGTKYYYLKNK